MSTVRTNTLSNLAGSQSIPVDRVAQGAAFAWVNFNGTGTIAIRRAYNLASITDNGVGDYVVNFTTPAPDANYAVACAATLMPGGTNVVVPCLGRYNNTVIAKEPSNFFLTLYPSGSGTGASADSPNVDAVVFR